MSGLSSFLPSRLIPSMHPNTRDRQADLLFRLRSSLENLPTSRKYTFTAATRAEILAELYDAFWGSYAHLFLPNSNSSLPLHATLSEVQASVGQLSQPQVVPGRPCGHIFKKGESCFRCKDCALDDSCVLCSHCFEATDHLDHNVSFFIAQQSGGCCDCGDVEAWRQSIQCPYHPFTPESVEHVSAFEARTLLTTPRPTPKILTGQDVPPVKTYPFRVSVPPDLRDSMSRTIAFALDYILDTLDSSPDETIVPPTEADLRSQPTGDTHLNDLFVVVVWNDDKHSFDEVIELLQDISNRNREEASRVADRIDEQGRDIVEMSNNPTRLLEIAQAIAQIDIGVTVRRALDTFREQVSAVIIEWLLDLTRSRLGTDALVMREVLAAELLSPRTTSTLPMGPNRLLPDIHEPTRFDWLFLYHARLWKKPRLNLKEIYASLLTLSHDHKLAISSHFAAVYHRIIDAYLLTDREAETSIKYFALQLFTVPSIALYIVRHHSIVSRLLAIIAAFFTNQIQDKRIIFPPDPDAEIDVDTFPFKSKRFMPVFSDLRYLCHNEPVQQLIAHNREFIIQFAKTCQIFMCINPNKRAASSHVEYETDAWISVFNVTLSLSRVIKVYGEAYSKATVRELITAIDTVIHHILMCIATVDDRRDTSRFPPVESHEVVYGERTYKIVSFDVMDGSISFHHSLQWLLAELFKHVDILDEASLRTIGMGSLRDVCLKKANEDALLTIIDYPLRVLAMIAQIRTGLWVRNGFAIRGQLLHYRDFMLRELCYDQDLFILQTALAILDPNTVLVSMLDRFQLLGYFSGATLHPSYDASHLSGMVEEFLYVLVTILTETASATKMPLPQAVRREIVHALAVGPCTFTDLVKRVAERMVDDVCFERVLKEVANFKAPESTADFGTYELKDEAFAEVNPFFYHYTRNKREEVEVILRNWLKKKTGSQDPVIVPQPLNITHGPFQVLPSIFESEVLAQIIFYGIYNVLTLTDATGSAPPSAEAVLDQVLHLTMVAIVERPEAFSRLAIHISHEEEKNLVDILAAFEHHEKYPTYKARVQWILDHIAEHQRAEVDKRRRFPDTSQSEAEDPSEIKKRAAKARQEAIMRQMKAQQASFAVNFEDIDDEDDEELADISTTPVSYGTCIVCQEELNDTKSFGSLGFVQPSKLLRRYPDGNQLYTNDALSCPESLDRVSTTPQEAAFPPSNADMKTSKRPYPTAFDAFPSQFTRFGLQASICSHMMHLDCFTVYSGSIRQRHRNQATRNHPESIPRKEYICPLCKSLGNVILPVVASAAPPMSSMPFSDWIRMAGINILKSKPDPVLESLQFRTGTGEFVFWTAQDSAYQSHLRVLDRPDSTELHKMVDTVMVVAKNISQQTRHLRDRTEPETGERGAGMYLPEEVVGYTISSLEVALRGHGAGGLVADSVTDSQYRMVRGLLTCLTKLAGLNFKGRPDEGREAVRQAIIKRLLPEWSRTSFTSFSHPLLLRDPFTILIETAAIAPEMLKHILILTYYAHLARTVVGLVYILNKSRSGSTIPGEPRKYENIFGDTRVFFMSVVRHSPIFEQAADAVFLAFGDARIERLLYTFTLPFLRRAIILCRAALPNAFPSPPDMEQGGCEYRRLLKALEIPPLSDLPSHDTIQNALSGWCAHYGHSQAASQLNCGVLLEHPLVYRLARLPLVLDHLYLDQDKMMVCPRCKTVPLDAAICLFCGTTCCFQSHCCMDRDSQSPRGECNMHTRDCAGAVGLYFLVKRCSLLYLYGNDGAFGQSPYLDVHGEVDVSMRRGRRQYLHHARWEDVHKIWLSHGIPTLISRRLEGTVDNGGWETL